MVKIAQKYNMILEIMVFYLLDLKKFTLYKLNKKQLKLFKEQNINILA